MPNLYLNVKCKMVPFGIATSICPNSVALHINFDSKGSFQGTNIECKHFLLGIFDSPHNLCVSPIFLTLSFKQEASRKTSFTKAFEVWLDNVVNKHGHTH